MRMRSNAAAAACRRGGMLQTHTGARTTVPLGYCWKPRYLGCSCNASGADASVYLSWPARPIDSSDWKLVVSPVSSCTMACSGHHQQASPACSVPCACMRAVARHVNGHSAHACMHALTPRPRPCCAHLDVVPALVQPLLWGPDVRHRRLAQRLHDKPVVHRGDGAVRRPHAVLGAVEAAPEVVDRLEQQLRGAGVNRDGRRPDVADVDADCSACGRDCSSGRHSGSGVEWQACMPSWRPGMTSRVADSAHMSRRTSQT